jgi:threonyl-tRNA synthetase
MQKVPYMLVVGDREQESNEVSVRLRSEEDLGAMPVDDLVKMIKSKVDKKALL